MNIQNVRKHPNVYFWVESAYYYDVNDANLYPIRCASHMLPTDVQLIKRQCSNCFDTLYFPENKEYCMQCGNYRERRLYHFKESIIGAFLRSNSFHFVHNKPILSGKSGFRPDFLFDSHFGYIILEVDEWQHKRGYNIYSEIERMRVIFSELRQHSNICKVLFLRYNPDNYEGIQHDAISKHNYLYNLLIHFIQSNDIGTDLGVVYLFYDGFNNTPQIQTINIAENKNSLSNQIQIGSI